MGWGQARRPKIANILSSPNPREGSDGDTQLRQTPFGAKLYGKLGGRWYSTPLSIKEGEFTLKTRNGSDSIKLDAATGLSIGNWNINKTSIYTGTEDHSTYTANAGDITIYSDGSNASIHAKEFYIDASTGRFFSTYGTLGANTQFADDIVTTASIANNAITDALLSYSAQSWTTNLEITGTAYNNLIWNNGSSTTNATITFADGTTQTIDHGNKTSGLSDNTTYFAYGTEGSTTLGFSGDYTYAIGANKILLATIVVTTSTGGASPSIFPYRTNALTISAASIAANAITATAIAAGTITANEIDTASITADILDVGTIIVGEVGVGKSNVQITSGAVKLRANDVARITLASNGDLTVNGDIIFTGALQAGGDVTASGIAIGIDASRVGAINTCVGYQAGEDFQASASGNSILGGSAGKNITTGGSNVCVGYTAGDTITEGNFNVCIGYGTDGVADVNNQIAIGNGATTSGQYGIAIGKNVTAAEEVVTIGQSSDYIWCDFGENDTWTHATSDRRSKKDIVDNTLGLSFINDLKTVTYKRKPPSEYPEEFETYDAEKTERKNPDSIHYGFIAQDVKEAMDNASLDKFPGWHISEAGCQSIGETEFITPLVKAVQELSAKIDTMQTEINNLKEG